MDSRLKQAKKNADMSVLSLQLWNILSLEQLFAIIQF